MTSLKKFNLLLLINFTILIFCLSCSGTDSTKLPPTPEDKLENSDLFFDFNNGWQGWKVGFADYSVGNEDIYELNYSLSTLPEEIDETKKAVLVSGHNRSDDLFMFLKYKIDTLEPNTEYDLEFIIEIASKYPQDSFGIGGSPGSSVFLRAGASTIEPEVIVEDSSPQDYYIMNIDKGNQYSDGTAMITLGNIGIESGDGETYKSIIRHNLNSQFSASSDSNGTLWVIIGTDSGFEGLTEIYYKRIGISIAPN